MTQFKEIYNTAKEICRKFGVKKMPRIIILNNPETNAFALKIAHKRALILTTKILEEIGDNPQELRFLLGHEIAHIAFLQNRGLIEIVQSAAYRAARELTCDNCGFAASEDLQSSINTLKLLTVGKQLISKLDDSYLHSESSLLYSGFSGWLLKRKLTHPPLGKRIANLNNFLNSPLL